MLKEQIIAYRLANRETRTLLGVVLGEIERVEKGPKKAAGYIATDEEVVSVLKKMIASNIECDTNLEENVILEQFLPQQLTEGQIEDVIVMGNFASIKVCMDHFKLAYAGRYNGKDVSKKYSQLSK